MMSAAGLAIALAACSPAAEPGVYPLSRDEAMDRLAKADIKGFRFARQCGILIHIAPQRLADGMIWRVTSSGRQVLSFTVRLSDAGGGKTRASIEVPADPKGGELYDGEKFYPRPALNQPLRPAVQELVDAAMAQRPYDVWQIPEPRNTDRVCSIQRGGLESGNGGFSIDDKPNMTARESRREAEAEARANERNMGSVADPKFGQPMDRAGGN